MPSIGDLKITIKVDTKQLRGNLATASSLIRDWSLLSTGLTAGLSSAFQKVATVGIKAVQMAIIGLSVAFGVVAKTGADFEDQIVRTFAILKEGSDSGGASLQELTNTALKMGSDTLFSATQAAKGMQSLARAGFDTKEVMAGIKPSIDLAIVGNMDLAEATDIAVGVLRGFNFTVDKASKVTDVLASASAKSNTTLSLLGSSLKFVAPIAVAAGISLEETSAALGILANAGIRGSMAGTTLRRAMQQLLNPSRGAEKVLSKLGVTTITASGNLRPLVSIINDLKRAGISTQEVFEVFGQRAATGMLALLNTGGGALSKLTNELENSQGAADRMSQEFRTTVAGRVRDLVASIQNLGLAFSQKFQKALASSIFGIRNYVKSITEAGQRSGMFKAFVEGVINVFSPLTSRIKDAAASFKEFLKNVTPKEIIAKFDELKDKVEAFIKAISKGGDIFETVNTAITVTLNALNVIFKISKLINAAWSALPKFITKNVGAIALILAGIVALMGGLINIISLFISIRALTGLISVEVALGAKTTGLWAIISTKLAAIWAGIASIISTVILPVVAVLGSIMAGLSLGKLIGELGVVKSFFTNIVLQAQGFVAMLKLGAAQLAKLTPGGDRKQEDVNVKQALEEVNIIQDAIKANKKKGIKEDIDSLKNLFTKGIDTSALGKKLLDPLGLLGKDKSIIGESPVAGEDKTKRVGTQFEGVSLFSGGKGGAIPDDIKQQLLLSGLIPGGNATSTSPTVDRGTKFGEGLLSGLDQQRLDKENGPQGTSLADINAIALEGSKVNLAEIVKEVNMAFTNMAEATIAKDSLTQQELKALKTQIQQLTQQSKKTFDTTVKKPSPDSGMK